MQPQKALPTECRPIGYYYAGKTRFSIKLAVSSKGCYYFDSAWIRDNRFKILTGNAEKDSIFSKAKGDTLLLSIIIPHISYEPDKTANPLDTMNNVDKLGRNGEAVKWRQYLNDKKYARKSHKDAALLRYYKNRNLNYLTLKKIKELLPINWE